MKTLVLTVASVALCVATFIAVRRVVSQGEKTKKKRRHKSLTKLWGYLIFPFLVSWLALRILIFGDPTPDEEDC